MIKHLGAGDMIANYLDGALSPEARLEFEDLMRRDAALEREVRAEGAIRRSLGKDTTPLPYTSVEPSSAITAKLAATPASGVAGGIASQAVAAGAAQNILGAIFGTTLGVTVLSVVGIAGLVLGIFLIAPMIRENDLPMETEQTVPPASLPSGNSVGNTEQHATAGSFNPQPSEADKNADARKKKANTNTPQVPPEGSLNTSVSSTGRSEGVETQSTAESEQSTEVDEMTNYLRSQESNTPRLIRKDSVKLKLNVEE